MKFLQFTLPQNVLNLHLNVTVENGKKKAQVISPMLLECAYKKRLTAVVNDGISLKINLRSSVKLRYAHFA